MLETVLQAAIKLGRELIVKVAEMWICLSCNPKNQKVFFMLDTNRCCCSTMWECFISSHSYLIARLSLTSNRKLVFVLFLSLNFKELISLHPKLPFFSNKRNCSFPLFQVKAISKKFIIPFSSGLQKKFAFSSRLPAHRSLPFPAPHFLVYSLEIIHHCYTWHFWQLLRQWFKWSPYFCIRFA